MPPQNNFQVSPQQQQQNLNFQGQMINNYPTSPAINNMINRNFQVGNYSNMYGNNNTGNMNMNNGLINNNRVMNNGMYNNNNPMGNGFNFKQNGSKSSYQNPMQQQFQQQQLKTQSQNQFNNYLNNQAPNFPNANNNSSNNNNLNQGFLNTYNQQSPIIYPQNTMNNNIPFVQNNLPPQFNQQPTRTNGDNNIGPQNNIQTQMISANANVLGNNIAGNAVNPTLNPMINTKMNQGVSNNINTPILPTCNYT